MKFKFPPALGLLACVVGCASHPVKIPFSDEPEIKAATVASAAPAPAPKRLDKADEYQIEQRLFGYLLERHFWDLGDYSAVFLQADDAEVQAVMRQYPTHVPPVKPSSHAQVRAHRPPLDKDTNKPAMILSADVNEPNADGTVDAIGRWYAGDAVAGFRTFRLKHVDHDWEISEVK